MASSQRPSISRHFAETKRQGVHCAASAHADGLALARAAALACGVWTLTACSGPGNFETSTSRGSNAAGRQDQTLSIERAQIPADEPDATGQTSGSQTTIEDTQDLPDAALRGERPLMLPSPPNGPSTNDPAQLTIESQPPPKCCRSLSTRF